MDSLTQATLGAAVGHLCWNEKIGKKALIAGALLGTLPDLDIALYPFLDGVQRLYWHRGESHSVWFIVLGSMGFGWLLARLHAAQPLSMYRAGIGAFLVFTTHIIIDLFTVYGTQLLAPLWRKGFSLNNMYIVDPLFTLPLLVGAVGAYLMKNRKAGSQLNQICLGLVSIYVIWSFTAQFVAEQKFHSALAKQNVTVSRQITSAGPFTTFLWRYIAETPDGFLLGYWSWFDEKSKPVRFQFIPRNESVIDNIRETRTFRVVDWFSQGWWFVAESNGKIARVVDLRFGEIPSDKHQDVDQWDYPFAWNFSLVKEDETRLKPVLPKLKDPAATLGLLLTRITGHGQWLSSPD